MKKILLAFIVLSSIACSSPEKKAQGVIKRQLKETLDDWSSYESIKFSTLDSAYTSVFDDSLYRKEFDGFLSVVERCEEYDRKIDEATNLANSAYSSISKIRYLDKAIKLMDEHHILVDSLSFYKNNMDKIEEDFVPKFKGWSMEHLYRAKDKNGIMNIYHKKYHFDEYITEIDKITDVKSE